MRTNAPSVEPKSGRRLAAPAAVRRHGASNQQASSITRLQRGIGNRAVLRLIEKSPAAAPSKDFLDPEWTDVGELGIVYKEGPLSEGGGANLRASPGGTLIRWLPQNTKVFILRKRGAPVNAFAVQVLNPDGSAGELGYIATSHVWTGLPDPDAQILKIKPGQSPIELAAGVYAPKGFNVWGRDPRYVVNALVWVNQQAKHNAPGRAGITKDALWAPWYSAKSTAGVYIWLPGVEYLKSIYDQVARHGGGTGSLSADMWRTVKFDIIQKIAFLGGVVHGFVKSIWDAIADLVTTVWDVLYSLFSGNIGRDASELWTAITSITWADIKNALGSIADEWNAKILSPDPWVSGHAQGYVVGYIIAEVAQIVLSGGALAAAKGALWASRFGKLLKATRAFMAFEKGLHEARTAGKLIGAFVKGKVFKALGDAKTWIGTVLRLTATTLADLSLEAINRLATLSDKALDTLRNLAEPLKRVVLGCASACKVDLEAIRKYVAATEAKAAAKAKKLTQIEHVLEALAEFDTTMIRKKLTSHPAIMEAIQKAGLTADDLAVVKQFLSTAENATAAYRTFVRTLSTLIPARVGSDIKALNAIAEAIVELEPRWGAAFKGPMFETFAKLHLDKFRGAPRAKWVGKDLAKARQCDAFVDGALWDFKHTVAKVPADQMDDYSKILRKGIESADGQKAKSVNLLFATKEGALLNAELTTKFGFLIHYIEPPNVLKLLK